MTGVRPDPLDPMVDGASVSSRRWGWLRLTISVALLAVLFATVDMRLLLDRLSRLSPRWVLLGVGISVVQIAASAWRWRFTAARLGVDLPFREAIREYYVASFLNQVLPGGVLGDVSRAVRHGRSSSYAAAHPAAAYKSVVIERASGQVVTAFAAGVSLLAIPGMLGAASPQSLFVGVVAVILALAIAAFLWRAVGPKVGSSESAVGRLWQDARAALFSGAALPAQLFTSVFVVSTYIAVYVIAARSIGVDTPTVVLLPLIAPVLVAMLIPLSAAGWGVREGAAALIWSLVGLRAIDGISISLAYGLLVLVSTLPGAAFLLVPRTVRGSFDETS